MNNYKTVFFAIGVLLIILGTFMIIPLFLQITYGEENKSFLSSTTITIFMGILLVLTNLEENRKLNLQLKNNINKILKYNFYIFLIS